MRNKSWMAAGAAGLLFLAGCSGATASVSDPDKELMTIGDVTYTRGQEYEYIKKSTGPNLVMQMAEEVIYDKEVPVTDEIRKQAEDNYNEYAKTSDNLESYIQSMGYKDRQDYIDKVLIPAVQAEKLLTKWFTDAQEEIVQEYKPSRVQIIQTELQRDGGHRHDDGYCASHPSDQHTVQCREQSRCGERSVRERRQDAVLRGCACQQQL